ncbi:DUF2461 domain-containing protein [Reichenbachiella carrageenanivorans]|uniref:DUF2461 domain-containing protein n=1 Tax=Reichenbachiella carrageenanivorans TaxID=2979869 RepID=A0ABY6D3H5_9BACT|nr:DUF2461 domain-containing protein [Reichenbachiella carrageenanivorans]UXX80454.1 DUF2461 domain-containing protein [Reichenbachiella carrageenanivorans]
MDLKPTLKFLNELSVNNNKDWFDANRKTYENCRKDFITLVSSIIGEIAKFDPELTDVDPKKCIFRINRDIRFSKDKTPYKTNFGALMGANGKKTEGTGFYIHLAPGQNFAGGGIYRPPAETLAAIRQEIDYNPDALQQLLETKDFQETFGEIRGDKLKTAPKGYPKDHPNIDLLRLKSFYVIREFNEKDLVADDFFESLVFTYKSAHTFNAYLKEATS